ncbi:MAG: DUF1501 domain-containing protein [Phycisphaeraceae bacterium]
MPDHLSNQPTYTRRRFLQTGLAMISTVASVPAFLSRSAGVLAADTAMDLSSKPGVPDDRVLVVVQLSGGNDGLNTVIPYGLPTYYRQRPTLAVPDNAVLPVDTDTGIGLHPALRDVWEMAGEGIASIVQGVGYPNPNRSHFASMDVWHTGDTNPTGSNRGRGWIGRALDIAKRQQPADENENTEAHNLDCITLGTEAPLATQGRHVKPIAFQRPELLKWTGRDMDPALGEAYDALHAGDAPGDGPDDPRRFIFRTALDAQVASERVRRAVARDAKTRFPQNPLANQLQMVAAMIGAELPTRVYYVGLGGFDTHANQPWQHQRLLEQFSSAMRAFYRELQATGHDKRVVTMAFSEFGRRVAQNGSGGTDHGTAGPLFLFGDAPRGGLHGMHPTLDELDNGDLIYTTDFRSIYHDLLTGWMKIDPRAALGQPYPGAGILQA